MGACTSDHLEVRKNSKKGKKYIPRPMKRSSSLTEEEIKQIVDECFYRFDKNRDGLLEFHEVIEMVKYSHNRSGIDKNSSDYSIREAAKKLMLEISTSDQNVLTREDFYKFYRRG